MATIVVEQDRLVIELGRKERFMTLRRSNVEVPFANIVSVEHVLSARAWSGYFDPNEQEGRVKVESEKGSFTGKLLLGTFQRSGVPETFVAAEGDDPGYLIRTNGEPYEVIAFSSEPIPALDAMVTGG